MIKISKFLSKNIENKISGHSQNPPESYTFSTMGDDFEVRGGTPVIFDSLRPHNCTKSGDLINT